MSTFSHDNHQFDIGAPTSTHQIQQLGHILTQCFNVSFEHWQTYIRQLGRDNLRIICQNTQVVGGLGLYPMGQWFGGQRIPMHGIAGVGIAPEHRGQGAASALLRHTLTSLRQQGIPLATLYASTSQLYRQVGFEQAGTYCQYQVPAQSIALSSGQASVRASQSLPMTAIDQDNLETLIRLHQQQARLTHGSLDRHPAIWEQMLESETPIYMYLIGSEQHLEGYIVFTHQIAPSCYDINIEDLVLLTPGASQRFWSFLADHRSLARNIYWHGAPTDAAQMLLAEQTYRVNKTERWLLRIVDIPKALTLRGYPLTIEAELHLQVDDPQLSANSGSFVLQIANGQGQVRSGGRGDLQISIRGLSPLYTSMLTAQDLNTLGLLAGSPKILDLATTIFRGPQPWLSDHF